MPDVETMFHPRQRSKSSLRPPRDSRGGAVTLEFIIALPVLLIILLAVVQFGMFFSGLQQVSLASRVGAEAAAQTDLSASETGDGIPADILNAINAQLASAGITACRIFVEHNVDGTDEDELQEPSTSTWTCTPPATALPLDDAHGVYSVRVTVCVPMSELAPNCLSLFKFDISKRSTQCSTTFRYER